MPLYSSKKVESNLCAQMKFRKSPLGGSLVKQECFSGFLCVQDKIAANLISLMLFFSCFWIYCVLIKA